MIDTTALRRRRYRRLARLVGLRPTDTIVDIGCGRGERSVATFNRTNPIVGVDLLPPDEIRLRQPNFTYRQGDATELAMFDDRQFDVAFSVGLLEHIHPRERLVAAIREQQRIASRYAAVITHRYAFLEPHFRMPLFSIWPDWMRKAVVRHLSPAGTRLRRDGSLRAINWLPGSEWLRLFDDPTARALNHWYGPLLQHQLIVGGRRGAGRPQGMGVRTRDVGGA